MVSISLAYPPPPLPLPPLDFVLNRSPLFPWRFPFVGRISAVFAVRPLCSVALWNNVSVLTFSCNCSSLNICGAVTTKMTLNQPNCSAHLMGGANHLNRQTIAFRLYLSSVNRAFYFRFGAVYSHCSSLGPRTLCMHAHTHTRTHGTLNTSTVISVYPWTIYVTHTAICPWISGYSWHFFVVRSLETTHNPDTTKSSMNEILNITYQRLWRSFAFGSVLSTSSSVLLCAADVFPHHASAFIHNSQPIDWVFFVSSAERAH